MARLDRCSICDYNEVEGSFFADIPPGQNGKVLQGHAVSGYYCLPCYQSILETLDDYEPPENDA